MYQTWSHVWRLLYIDVWNPSPPPPALPQGVPKFPTKYNPYKRSSNRRGNNDLSEGAGGSMADVFSGGHLGNGSGNGGAGSGGAGRGGGGGDGEMNGLTWQAHDGIDDSGGISTSGSGGIGTSGGGISSSGGGDMSSSGGGGASGLSPRRKSYLWKRPTAKPGGDGGGGGGGAVQSYASAAALLRPRLDAETVTVASQESGAAALLDGRPSASGHADVGAARRPSAAGAMPADAGNGATAAAAATVADGEENAGRDGGDLSGREAQSGDGGGGVELLAGVKDGGDGHRFRVRAASFLADGREVRACAVSRSYPCLSYVYDALQLLRAYLCVRERYDGILGIVVCVLCAYTRCATTPSRLLACV